MKRTQPHILAPLRLERKMLTNDRNDIGRITDALTIIMLWRKCVQISPSRCFSRVPKTVASE